jgi:hypothetical protein
MGTQDQGTPSDYDKAYQAEMDRLEAEAAKATTSNTSEPTPAPTAAPEGEPAPTPAPSAAPEGEPTPLEARIAQLEQELGSTKKALNDTKGWASNTAAELKRLKREQAERERLANPPQVLRDNPGLDEAIRYVTGAPAPGQPQQHDPDAWAEAVGTALPDLDGLLAANPDLHAKAQAKAKELGEAWNNPIVAIRELGALQLEHERNRMAAAAQDAARRDFQQRQQKQTAMQVPGAGGGNSRPNQQPRDDAGRWASMSSADFAKERARVLGMG